MLNKDLKTEVLTALTLEFVPSDQSMVILPLTKNIVAVLNYYASGSIFLYYGPH